MTHERFFGAVALACVLAFSGPVGAAVPAAQAKAVAPTKTQYTAFKKSSAEFSTDLFAACVAESGTKNTVVAPMSVLMALALMGNGASGKTLVEMQDLLAGSAKIKTLDRCLLQFNSKLVDSKDAQLKSANAIWYANDGTIKLKSAFVKANRTYFDALVEAADFSSPKTPKAINSWVSKQTNKMIPKVIDQLDEDAKSVLVNTLHLNAKWAVPYDKGQVGKSYFTNAKGVKKKVKMLHGTERSYISGKGVTGFIKPYRKGYSFVALLPEKGTSLADFAKGLDGKTFTKLVKKATNERVITTMPKLDVSYTNDKLATTLAGMGLKRATDENAANFTKMATLTRGKLYIGDVIHKTRLKLDEEGTQAAAVTAVIAKASSAVVDPVPPKVVTLDRPYVFAVIDNKTKLPLFMGAVNDVK